MGWRRSLFPPPLRARSGLDCYVLCSAASIIDIGAFSTDPLEGVPPEHFKPRMTSPADGIALPNIMRSGAKSSSAGKVHH